MDWKDIVLIAGYEAKKTSRTWLFRFFALTAIIGITAYQAVLQGGMDCSEWQLVALPCCIPLVNAYLFNVFQSFFLIFLITDIPRQENSDGTGEILWVRPMENRSLLSGHILGLLFLFAIVNTMVMLCGMIINLGSLSPFNFWYYLFYTLTLNIPSFFFMTGFCLCVARIVRIRFLTLLILIGFLGTTIVYLPYHGQGVWDFLAVGIPNLFSDIDGHVGLRLYLLHRLLYLFAGIGLLSLSALRMKRLANGTHERIKSTRKGLIALLASIICATTIEWEFHITDKQRTSYTESFTRHWNEHFCRVLRHDIHLRQEGKYLNMTSDMLLWNQNQERLDTLVLFLNPGLEVSELTIDNQTHPFTRDGQVIIITRPLSSGDTLLLRLTYNGEIDERIVDLHLTPAEYHDSFHGRSFFPTGRRGAFIGEDFLLLTPACIWYPVTVPPVNPTNPIFTRETFTLYSIEVEPPLQETLLSQGMFRRKKERASFTPSDVLTGISLCGGKFKHRRLDMGELKVSLSSFGDHAKILDYYPINNSSINLYLKENFYPMLEIEFSNLDWYDKQTKALYFVETPLSFYTEYSTWKYLFGQVEPGIVFLPERGFTLNLMGFINTALNKNYTPSSGIFVGTQKEDKGRDLCKMLQYALNISFVSKENATKNTSSVHPFGIGGWRFIPETLLTGRLFSSPGVLVQSSDYPFINMFLKLTYVNRYGLSKNQRSISTYSEKEVLDHIVGRDIMSILSTATDVGMTYHVLYQKQRDLLNYLLLDLPMDTLYGIWEDIYQARDKEITLEQLTTEINERSNKKINILQNIQTWLTSKNRQFFAVKDWSYSYQKLPTGNMRVELSGKVMNQGKDDGLFSVDMTFLPNFYIGEFKDIPPESYPVYIKPKEAKQFHFVFEKSISRCIPILNMGLATNLPNLMNFEDSWTHKREISELLSPAIWKNLDTAMFNAPTNILMVDDQNENFSIKNSKKKPLFQRIFRKENMATEFSEKDYWEYSIGQYQGDSIRGCYTKGARDGSSTATWKITLSDTGTYEIKAYVLRYEHGQPLGSPPPANVVYHYLVEWDGKKEKVEVPLDEQMDEHQQKGWVSLGKFEFPAGEVSVTLFDRDNEKRERLVIMADAVIWEKL